jgi:hypothetical protein
MSGVGISAVIVDAQAGDLATVSRRLLGGSVGAGLIGLGMLETTLRENPDEPTHRRISPMMKIGSGVAVTALTWFDLGWNAVSLSTVLFLALAAQAVYGAYVWFKSSEPISNPVNEEVIRDDRVH